MAFWRATQKNFKNNSIPAKKLLGAGLTLSGLLAVGPHSQFLPPTGPSPTLHTKKCKSVAFYSQKGELGCKIHDQRLVSRPFFESSR